MMSSAWLLADEVTRTTFEWGRIQSNADWILPVIACLAVLLLVRALYRRDAVDLRPLVGWLLTALRTAAFFGLLVLYLQPHWRAEREVVRNSRALLLVDTSLSMGQTDAQPSAHGGASRAEQVAAMLAKSDFLGQLRRTHDVAVYQFSEDLHRDRVISLPKDSSPRSLPQTPAANDANAEQPGGAAAEQPIDWCKALAPTGTETRLGQALRQLIHDERNTPVAGVVLFSDGGQNAGVSPETAVALAQEAKLPVFTVGLGSDRPPSQVRVVDLAAPARAYPGDRYTVTGYLQSQGMAGKTVTVQLLMRAAGGDRGETPRTDAGNVLESRPVTLGGDGEILPVKFELTPDAPGRRTISFRLQGGENPSAAGDRQREADIEIVDHKSHVLLLAGGPTREYQFLRSQIFRDHSTTLDILLQTGAEGMSQEAKKLLASFPSTRPEMFDYDCVVGFDPDWQALSAAQLNLLETWVAEQAGGLLVVAGPVNAGKTIKGWLQNPAMKTARSLYPVEFPRRLDIVETSVATSKDSWPLDFTREGLNAEFLWLGDTASASRQAWASFPGVYSVCAVRGPKPAATVFARVSDPRANQNGEQAVYFAGQFYGSGRVFYMGSGEMWRLRAVDPAYFERFYTKLIRHVSQGRLLRGSKRGVLLVAQDRYMIGNTVEVRAQLTNARLEPLDVPAATVEVIQPSGGVQTVPLRCDPARAGAYVGQFPVLQEGTYRLELPVPERERERLTRRIQVNVPNLERENPRRNDALLAAVANSTGGKYYVGVDAIMRADQALAEQLPDRTNTVVLTAAPNPKWEETFLRGMMLALCGLLCCEWLIRRLMRLA
jgi:hypothetical protein